MNQNQQETPEVKAPEPKQNIDLEKVKELNKTKEKQAKEHEIIKKDA